MDGVTATKPASRGSGWLRWALAAGLVVAVVAAYFLGLTPENAWNYLRGHLEGLHQECQDHFVVALLLFFLGYTACAALSLPIAAILTLAAGALFGLVAGTAVVSAASTLGATLAFLTSRYILGEAVRSRFGGRLAAFDEGVKRDGPYYLFTLRLVPLVPFFLVNLGSGLTQLPVRTFAWVSMVGMLPGTILYVNFGTELGRLESPRGLLSPGLIASLALLGLFPLLARWVLRLFGRTRTAPPS